ncbi:hypothetical protein M0812_00841 [Anaeramoeba flamelloides]|uniref:B box-type domain-containing protein n=1 Tax=Anaeramoeba flamelloides TaxID=1746091 RepID=A0AAV8A2H6_9EUKA|nr:hypothetical protein M0812_00841 [Anaeramoeba flamelloides]
MTNLPIDKCSVCKKEPPTSFCKVCNKLYCETHTEEHSKEGHEVYEIGEETDTKIIICSTHFRLNEILCCDCDRLICPLCADNHTGHKTYQVTEIHDKLKTQLALKQKEAYKLILSCKMFIERIDDLIKEIKREKIRTLSRIKFMFDTLTDLVNNKKLEITQQAEQISKNKIKTINELGGIWKEMQKTLKNYTTIINKAIEAKEKGDIRASVYYYNEIQNIDLQKLQNLSEQSKITSMGFFDFLLDYPIQTQVQSLSDLTLEFPFDIAKTIFNVPEFVPIGHFTQLVISLRDENKKPIETNIYPEIKINWQTPTGDIFNKYKFRQGMNNGKFYITAQPKIIGIHKITITINNEPILNSKTGKPVFQIEVKPPYDLENSEFIYDEVIVENTKYPVQFLLKDFEGNPIDVKEDLNISCVLHDGKSTREIEMEKVENKNGLWLGEFSLKIENKGSFEFKVKNNPIKGSPFKVQIGNHEDTFEYIHNYFDDNDDEKKETKKPMDIDDIFGDNDGKNKNESGELVKLSNFGRTVENCWDIDNNPHYVTGATQLFGKRIYHFQFRIKKKKSKTTSLQIGICDSAIDLESAVKGALLFDCGKACKIQDGKQTDYGQVASEGSIVEMWIDFFERIIKYNIIQKPSKKKKLKKKQKSSWFPIAFENIPQKCLIIIVLFGREDKIAIVPTQMN